MYYIVEQLLQGITRSVSQARTGNKAPKMAFFAVFSSNRGSVQLNLLFVNQSRISKVEHMSDLAIF